MKRLFYIDETDQVIFAGIPVWFWALIILGVSLLTVGVVNAL